MFSFLLLSPNLVLELLGGPSLFPAPWQRGHSRGGMAHLGSVFEFCYADRCRHLNISTSQHLGIALDWPPSLAGDQEIPNVMVSHWAYAMPAL